MIIILKILLILVLNFSQIFLPINIEMKNFIFQSNQHFREEKVNSIWQISIDKFGLTAQIKDGVSNDTLNEYVGHFTQSGYILRKCGTSST